ncbi:histidine phosphatase family protein [Terasakiella sp. A23]|uniref:histidine phosphatase family protein n=1 Tax=Terasakiella sp. FCG-A23 TaxID=3080561 RepID=UPI0029533F9F|nr:histidine phosphatase family protein [Terasakiella sp. A23]MDV7338234.1 histidine phosphatase family protein [Terasakiella sp. A23]
MTSQYFAFIRHGDYHQMSGAPSAYQPFGLTEDAKIQVAESLDILEEIVVEQGFVLNPVIDSSTLLRAWQTAEIYRENLDGVKRVNSFDCLAERGVGAVANLTTDAIEQILEDDPRFEAPPENWKSNSHYRLPFIGAESLMEAGARVAKHVRDTLRKQTVKEGEKQLKLFVGHGAAFRHAAHHLGVLSFDEIAKLSMYHSSPVVFELNKLGKYHHVAGNWKIRTPKEGFTD